MFMSSKACKRKLESKRFLQDALKLSQYANGNTYQRSTAEENHKDYKGLKPVVLHNNETSPTEVPPGFASTFGDVHSETWPSLNTAFG